MATPQQAFPGDWEAKKLLYTEICNSCGRLLDIRFKLLALVPSISLGAVTILLNQKPAGIDLTISAKLWVSLMGLLSSVAIFCYDRRNNQVRKEFVKRGADLEDKLGVKGQFSGVMPTGFISHGWAVGLIYTATILGWLFPIFAILSKLCLCGK